MAEWWINSFSLFFCGRFRSIELHFDRLWLKTVALIRLMIAINEISIGQKIAFFGGSLFSKHSILCSLFFSLYLTVVAYKWICLGFYFIEYSGKKCFIKNIHLVNFDVDRKRNQSWWKSIKLFDIRLLYWKTNFRQCMCVYVWITLNHLR